jgi:hypothetical protein
MYSNLTDFIRDEFIAGSELVAQRSILSTIG